LFHVLHQNLNGIGLKLFNNSNKTALYNTKLKLHLKYNLIKFQNSINLKFIKKLKYLKMSKKVNEGFHMVNPMFKA